MILKGTLTDDNIARGVRGSCTDCPYALATRQALPKDFVGVVRIGHTTGTVGNTGFPVPVEVGSRIAVYDAGGSLYPHSFEFDVPNSSDFNEAFGLFWGASTGKPTKKRRRK